jgi:hypothetical protein
MNANLDPTLANRYLADQLSDQERYDYEALLVSSPEAVSELEVTARLKVGLAKLRDTGELDHLLRQPHRLLQPFLMPLAATLTAIAIGVTLWWSTLVHTGTAPLLFTSHTSLVERAGHPLSTKITAAFYAKRAEIPTPSIEKPTLPAEVVLRVLPAPLNKLHQYRLSLSRLHNSAFEVVAEIDHLTPTSEDNFVECYADAARLTPGHYQVVVTDETMPSGTDAGVFRFDLVASQKR